MDKIFDCLIDSYLKGDVGLSDNFLNIALTTNLKTNLLALYDQNKFKDAGIGNDGKLTHDKLIRSDKIYWLDRKHNDLHENLFFDLIDQFILYLNRTCYAGITDYEFHYAMYEKGSFYKKHLDQFMSNKSRAFSMIMYLNEDWKEGDGGELCIYHTTPERSQKISPNNGKCVFFKSSELVHEVLINQHPRLSITGWLKIDS